MDQKGGRRMEWNGPWNEWVGIQSIQKDAYLFIDFLGHALIHDNIHMLGALHAYFQRTLQIGAKRESLKHTHVPRQEVQKEIFVVQQSPT